MIGKPPVWGQPPAAAPEPTPEESPELDEQQSLVAWRYLMLLDLGFSVEQALIATRPNFDWHAAERLIRKGCTPDLVVQLLEE